MNVDIMEGNHAKNSQSELEKVKPPSGRRTKKQKRTGDTEHLFPRIGVQNN